MAILHQLNFDLKMKFANIEILFNSIVSNFRLIFWEKGAVSFDRKPFAQQTFCRHTHIIKRHWIVALSKTHFGRPMEQHIFLNVIDNRGHHWKGIAICNVIEFYLQQNLCFNKQNFYFALFGKNKRITNL